jgi:hypothetical protein
VVVVLEWVVVTELRVTVAVGHFRRTFCRQAGWLADWLTDGLTDGLTHWLTDGLTD